MGQRKMKLLRKAMRAPCGQDRRSADATADIDVRAPVIRQTRAFRHMKALYRAGDEQERRAFTAKMRDAARSAP